MLKSKLLYSALAALLVATPLYALTPEQCAALWTLAYPKSPKGSTVEKRFGIEIPDPYRWLENYASKETRQWLKEQNALVDRFLTAGSEVAKARKHLDAHFAGRYPNDRKDWVFKDAFGKPRAVSEHYYFLVHPKGLDSHEKLYRSKAPDFANGELVLDTRKGPAQDFTDIQDFNITADGKKLVYSVERYGSDWKEIRVKNLETGAEEADRLRYAKSGYIVFDEKQEGFLYSRFDRPENLYRSKNDRGKIYYHRLGTKQSADKLIYKLPEGRIGDLYAYYDGKPGQVVIGIGGGEKGGSEYLIFDKLQDAFDGKTPKTLVPPGIGNFEHIQTDEKGFLFLTDYRASMRKIVRISQDATAPNRWETVIPEVPGAYLEGVNYVGDHLIATYLRNGRVELRAYTHGGELIGEIPAPGHGSIANFRRTENPDEILFTYHSHLNPGEDFRLNVRTRAMTSVAPPNRNFNPDDYVFEMKTVISKDGTEVPVQLLHKKGIQLDGSNPTLLYGYGGFAVNLLPGYNPSNLLWLDLGGVLAIPNLRGGSELGEEWHRAGAGFFKQNTFDDFTATAEWLVKEKYTSKAKLAVNGGSNGGLLAAVTAIQRPDLIAAAIPDVGVHDMVRFREFTRGFHWVEEYGSSYQPADLAYLLQYSPIHSVKPGTEYPAILIKTGSKDDRVSPVHSYKLAATLQNAQPAKGNQPILLRNYPFSAHGPSNRAESAKQTTDNYLFLFRVLDMKMP